jgi:hypothetical protein
MTSTQCAALVWLLCESTEMQEIIGGSGAIPALLAILKDNQVRPIASPASAASSSSSLFALN